LDKYNIKVIRKGQFIIFMHILESCKNGDAIPNSIPYSIIQSTGAEKEMEDRTIPCNDKNIKKFIIIIIIIIICKKKKKIIF